MSEYFTYSALVRGTLAKAADVNARFQAVDTGFAMLPAARKLQENRTGYYVPTGTGDALVVAMDTALVNYQPGLKLTMKVAATNTGAATINIDGLGVKSIKRFDGTALSAGDLTLGQIVELIYDGTSFVLGSASSAAASAAASAASAAASAASITPSSLMHLSGTETVTGAKTFNLAGNFNSSTQIVERIRLSGTEYMGGVFTSTDGVGITCHVNRANNRQIGFLDTARIAANATNPLFVIGLLTTPSTAIFSQSTDGTVNMPLDIRSSALTVSVGVSGSGVVIGNFTTTGFTVTGNLVNTGTGADAFVQNITGSGKMRTAPTSTGGFTLNLRGAATKDTSLVFTEETVSDRWSNGLKAGDTSLYWSASNDWSAVKLTLTSGGLLTPTGGISINGQTLSGLTAAGKAMAEAADATAQANLLGQYASTINVQNAAYTFLIGDAGKTIYHSEATTARTYTIPSNASVAYPVGTIIRIKNKQGSGNITLGINSDTLHYSSGSTGSRTIAPGGIAVIQKMESTLWDLSGTGIT